MRQSRRLEQRNVQIKISTFNWYFAQFSSNWSYFHVQNGILFWTKITTQKIHLFNKVNRKKLCRYLTRCNLTQHVALLMHFVSFHMTLLLCHYTDYAKISDKATIFAKISCLEDFYLRKTRLLIEFTQLNKQWLNELTSKNIDAKLTT